MCYICRWCGRKYEANGSEFSPYCSRLCQKAGRLDLCGEDRELSPLEIIGLNVKRIKEKLKKKIWAGVVFFGIVALIECCSK